MPPHVFPPSLTKETKSVLWKSSTHTQAHPYVALLRHYSPNPNRASLSPYCLGLTIGRVPFHNWRFTTLQGHAVPQFVAGEDDAKSTRKWSASLEPQADEAGNVLEKKRDGTFYGTFFDALKEHRNYIDWMNIQITWTFEFTSNNQIVVQWLLRHKDTKYLQPYYAYKLNINQL